MMPAADVARLAYRGLAAGRRVVIAGTTNRLTALVARYAPHRLTLPVTERLMAD